MCDFHSGEEHLENIQIIVIENNSEKEETFHYYEKLEKNHSNYGHGMSYDRRKWLYGNFASTKVRFALRKVLKENTMKTLKSFHWEDVGNTDE